MNRMQLLLFLLLVVPSLHASECSPTGQSIAQEGWSSALRRVCLRDSTSKNVFSSPDGQKALVAEQGGFSLTIRAKKVAWAEGKQFGPAGSEISWSPTSSAFFINYGDGSGLDGWTIHVFSIRGSEVVDHPDVNGRIVQSFRNQIRCPKDAVDPNVRGLGWSRDGSLLFAFAQRTVSEPCEVQGDFRGAVVTVSDGSLREFYSETEAKAHFHDRLPYNMR